VRAETRTFGRISVTGFSAGAFKVDGGAMFGVVPRSVWSRECPPDAENRVPLALNCFLVRTPKALILADTGIGTLLDRRHLDFYGFGGDPGLEVHLAALGFRPGDIDIVFQSHLHFDHCGGNVKRDASGAVVPAFPKARYVVRKGEWAAALHPVERDKPSYIPRRLRPLEASGRLDLIEADGEIADGVKAVLVPGHTAFHQCLKVTDRGAIFFFAGDLVPTAAHVGPDAIMSYDLFPAETLDNKKKVCARALAGDWVLGFSHDPHRFFGKIGKTGREYTFRELKKEMDGTPRIREERSRGRTG
jgi:glyoxylase-like metal-dependent hydrolase (beta-lactamase superfamily II)